jgi:hypothetical protein
MVAPVTRGKITQDTFPIGYYQSEKQKDKRSQKKAIIPSSYGISPPSSVPREFHDQKANQIISGTDIVQTHAQVLSNVQAALSAVVADIRELST